MPTLCLVPSTGTVPGPGDTEINVSVTEINDSQPVHKDSQVSGEHTRTHGQLVTQEGEKQREARKRADSITPGQGIQEGTLVEVSVKSLSVGKSPM